jgi:hypothetical protein
VEQAQLISQRLESDREALVAQLAALLAEA